MHIIDTSHQNLPGVSYTLSALVSSLHFLFTIENSWRWPSAIVTPGEGYQLQMARARCDESRQAGDALFQPATARMSSVNSRSCVDYMTWKCLACLTCTCELAKCSRLHSPSDTITPASFGSRIGTRRAYAPVSVKSSRNTGDICSFVA